MSVNKRNKKYIDDCLSVVQEHCPEEAEAIRKYIEHLEAYIAEWQEKTGEKHPSIGF